MLSSDVWSHQIHDSSLTLIQVMGPESTPVWPITQVNTVNVFAMVRWALNMSFIIFPSCWPGSKGVDSDVNSLWLQPAASGWWHRSGCADGSGSQLRPHSCSFLLCAARAHEGTGWDFKSAVNSFITYGEGEKGQGTKWVYCFCDSTIPMPYCTISSQNVVIDSHYWEFSIALLPEVGKLSER